MATRTITLTNRPPIQINEDNWPVIASASDKEFDNQYEFQANRTSNWWVKVRKHADGRTIVYAGYSYSSSFMSERDYSARRGVLLSTMPTPADAICLAIREVCRDMAQAEHHEEDANRWPTLAAACIATMPAEVLE